MPLAETFFVSWTVASIQRASSEKMIVIGSLFLSDFSPKGRLPEFHKMISHPNTSPLISLLLVWSTTLILGDSAAAILTVLKCNEISLICLDST
jgi:hypothetical protein